MAFQPEFLFEVARLDKMLYVLCVEVASFALEPVEANFNINFLGDLDASLLLCEHSLLVCKFLENVEE